MNWKLLHSACSRYLCFPVFAPDSSGEAAETKEFTVGGPAAHPLPVPRGFIPAQLVQPSQPSPSLSTDTSHTTQLQCVAESAPNTARRHSSFTSKYALHTEKEEYLTDSLWISTVWSSALIRSHTHTLTHGRIFTDACGLKCFPFFSPVIGYSSLLSDNDVNTNDTPGSPPPMPPKKHPHEIDNFGFSSEVIFSFYYLYLKS